MGITIESLKASAGAVFPEVQRIRRHIHKAPELSFEEYNTAAFISNCLTGWGIEHRTGVAGTGIVALLKGEGNGQGRCVAIRAELDALPITEADEKEYRSANEGVMHACGHDVHTAILLGVAKILHDSSADWSGTAKLIFQPGEEKHPGGGSIMIAEGVLQQPEVDAILGLHVYPTLPAGNVGFRSGQYMASTDEIHIVIRGKGGHAALPHQTVDPIAIAAQCITALQQVISRRSNPVSPSVLSFGRISGGTVNNVIPDFVEISGTLRTMSEAWREEAHGLIRAVVENTCSAFGAKAEIDIPKGYPSLFNDPAITARARSSAQEFLGEAFVKELDLRMTADDFAFYSQAIPGCYFRLGTNRDGKEHTASVHNPHFDIAEEAMETGVGTMAWIALELLHK
jgi:hippurate hydrolase